MLARIDFIVILLCKIVSIRDYTIMYCVHACQAHLHATHELITSELFGSPSDFVYHSVESDRLLRPLRLYNKSRAEIEEISSASVVLVER